MGSAFQVSALMRYTFVFRNMRNADGISSNDLRKMFDPIIKQIIELLQQQIEDANREAEREAINVGFHPPPDLYTYLTNCTAYHFSWRFWRLRVSAARVGEAL